MTINNYATGEFIGNSSSINDEAYEAYLASDNSGTGAVKAGDWLSAEEIAEFGITADATIFAE